MFYEEMVDHFMKNKDKLKTHLEAKSTEFGIQKVTKIKTSLYGMIVSIDYTTLIKYFDRTSKNIKKHLVEFKTKQEAIDEQEETQKV